MDIANTTRKFNEFPNTSNLYVFKRTVAQINPRRWQYCYAVFVVIFLLYGSVFSNLIFAEELPLSISPSIAVPGQTIKVHGEGFEEGARAFVLDGGPFVTGGVQIPGSYKHIAASGNFAYLAGFRKDFNVVDISNPQFPVVIGSINNMGSINSLAISGNYAYVAAGSAGLSVIDISNPHAPMVVGNLWFGWANNVTIDGNFAYVSYHSSLTVIDISNPRKPKKLYKFLLPEWITNITIVDNFAYVDLSRMDIQVFDITNPHSLVRVGRVENTSSLNVISIVGNILYAFGEDGLEIIDITHHQAPIVVGSVDIIGDVGSAAVAGNFVYVAEGTDGLIEVIDISNPRAPKAIGIAQISGWANDISVIGNFAYVAADSNGLQVIDITQRHSPKSYAKISSIDMLNTWVGAHDVAIAGNYAYVADGFNGMQVIDIRLPEAPELVTVIDTPGGASLITVDGHFAYLVDGYTDLQVIDISIPISPVIVGSADIPGDQIFSVKIEDNYVYFYTHTFVSPQSSGIFDWFVFDISNPLSPVLIDSDDTPTIAPSVDIFGNFSYELNGYVGFKIIDVSNPQLPIVVGRAYTYGDAWKVTSAGNFVYLADGPNGLSIFPAGRTSSTVFNNSNSLDVVLPSNQPVGTFDVSVLNPDGTLYRQRNALIVSAPGFERGDLDKDGDVDKDDQNILFAARNTPAIGEGDPRDLDGDGVITGLDGRKQVLLCTRPRCATE